MPKNKVSDPITDQEIAFARLVLSGTMTDQRAARAVGLNPNTAAYTKSKPCVRAFMHEHRALVYQQLVEQEAEGARLQNQRPEQVLARLWEIANMSSEMTRGSISGQVKALSMIVAIEGLIPDRRANSVENRPLLRPHRSIPPLGSGSRRQPPAPRKKMGLAIPRPNPLQSQQQTRTSALTAANPPSPIALASRNAIVALCRFCPGRQGSLLYRQERLRAPLTSELAPNAPRALKGSNFIEFYENRGDIPPIPTMIPAPHPDFLLRSAGRGRA